MKTKTYKPISILLCIAMLLSLIPMAVFAEDSSTVKITDDSNSAEITKDSDSEKLRARQSLSLWMRQRKLHSKTPSLTETSKK